MTIWKRLLRALLWAATALCVAKDCRKRISVVGVEGEDTVLSPSVAGDGSLTKINWKKGENIVAGSSFPPGKEKQRLSLDSSSGNLLLKNLSKEDTGNYTADIFINEKITEVCFDLKILVWPDINCTVHNDTIQLRCTSASEEYLPLRYSWDYIGNEEMTYKDSVVQFPRNSNHFQKITCIVTAFNSSANNSIHRSDCIILEEEPDHQSTNIPLIIRITVPIIVLVLVLALAFVYCYIKKHLKKRKERNARANCKEESSELPGEEREPLTELESLGGKEKSEGTLVSSGFCPCVSECRRRLLVLLLPRPAPRSSPRRGSEPSRQVQELRLHAGTTSSSPVLRRHAETSSLNLERSQV